MKLKKQFVTLTPDQRLYELKKPILGLTGGIASGKSTVSEMLNREGIQIISADHLVKVAYQKKEVQEKVAKLSPVSVSGSGIDFKILREQVFNNSVLKQEIEKVIYTELPALFVEASLKQTQSFIIYDVPLLFERNLHSLVDQKICVYCEPQEQRRRLAERDQNDLMLIEKMINSQMPLDEKKKQSDYVIDNSFERRHLESEVQKMLTYYFD